jgi:hypothetical protein
MIRTRDSNAASGTAYCATTPLASGASDLAGLGDHLNSPPVPKIHIQDDADEARLLWTNKVACALNDPLDYDSAVLHGTSAADIPSALLEANPLAEDGISQRSRSDSLSPVSSHNKLRGAPLGSFSSHDGVEIDLDGHDLVAQLTRRRSFGGPPLEDEEHLHGSDLDVCAPPPSHHHEQSLSPFVLLKLFRARQCTLGI